MRMSCVAIAASVSLVGRLNHMQRGGVTLLHRNLHRNGIMFSPKELGHHISLDAPAECVLGNALRRHAKT